MNCFPELTYSIYADSELPTEEARAVEAHLVGCPRCRALVQALRAETRLLAEVLQEEGIPARVAAPVRTRDILWTTAAVLGVAAVLQTALDMLSELRPPAGLDWLSPFSFTVQVSLFFRSLFYSIQGGATMLASTVTTVSILALGLLVVAGGILLVRRRPRSLAVLVALAVAFGLALPGSALERRKSNVVTVPSGETVDDTLLAAGDTVHIDGIVTGNLIAGGRRITIKGTVKGDAICFAQSVEVDGTVEGNVFSFARDLSVRGQVAHSLHGFAQTFRLESPGGVEADLIAFVDQLSLDGTVGRDARLFAGSVDVRGTIGRHLTAHAGRLTLLRDARVAGDLTAYVAKRERAHIDPGATIAGKTNIQVRVRPSRYSQSKFYFWQAVRLGAAFVTGLLLFWLFPVLFRARLTTAGGVLRTLGIGFLVLVVTPLAAVLVGITLIGLPIGLLGLVVWLAGLYLAKIFVAGWLGQALRRPESPQTGAFALPLLLGLVIVFVAMNLPYLGGLIRFLVILLGLGIALVQVRQYWQRPQALV